MAGESNSAFLLMNERRLRGEFCDFEVRVEDQVYQVHRLVLDTKSEYFQTMFGSNMLEAHQQYCNEPDITARAAKACIDCMYTSQMELDENTVVEILKAAHKWQIQEAVERCEEFLEENLELESCIETMKLSSLYSLENLRNKCHRYILSNLEKASGMKNLNQLEKLEILDLIKQTTGQVSPSLWDFCTKWDQTSSGKSLCAMVADFRFESFSIHDFRHKVWNSEHLGSCEKCKLNAARSFLRGLHESHFVMAAEDAIFLKKISKLAGNRTLEIKVDEYIVQKHRYVFCDYDFLQIEEDDFLKYVEEIDDECSLQEFCCIIQWMKRDESRHGAFKQLFKHAENPDQGKTSNFLAGLGNINWLATRRLKKVDRDFDATMNVFMGKLSWWPKDSLFLKARAQEFGFTNIETKLDICIVRDFVEVSLLDDFTNLGAEDLIKYISTPNLYLLEEPLIWNAVLVWVNHDVENRRKTFPRLFDAMLLHKFSTKFLRETVISCKMVKHSNSSMFSIMRLLLERVQNLEDDVRDLKKNFEELVLQILQKPSG